MYFCPMKFLKAINRKTVKRIAINFVGILLLAIGLSQVTTDDLSTLPYFSSAGITDYDSSDFYQFVANARNERLLDNHIVIVPIDTLSRMDIATLVEDISLCNPAAIGLDVFFGYVADHDSLLLELLKQEPRLVLPMGVDAEGDEGWKARNAYLFDSTQQQRGVINLNISTPYSVVRNFRPYYQTDRGKIPHFTTALARMAVPESETHLQQWLSQASHGEEDEEGQVVYINYGSREYEIIEPSQVIEKPEALENKVVLLGTLNDMQDVHITPISEQMPGILIHAYTLSTILDADELTPLPKWAQWLLAIVLSLCFVMVSSASLNYRASNLFMRLFQIAMFLLVVVCGTLLFFHLHLIVDLTFPLSLIALGLLALDLWNGILGVLRVKDL